MINLIPADKEHSELIRVWRNKNTKRFFNTNFVSHVSHIRWFKEYRKKYLNRDETLYIIYYNDFPVGMIGVVYDRNRKEVELTKIVMGEVKYRKKGIMFSVIRNLISEFTKIGYRLVLEVRKDNIPAFRLYKKCGFVITESLPQVSEDLPERLKMEYEENQLT